MVALRKEEAMSLAEGVVSSALKKGANEAEAFTHQAFATKVIIERGQIARNTRIIDEGLGVRIIIDKTIGFAYTNVTKSKQTVEDTISKAISSAKASKPDEDWCNLPSDQPKKRAEDTYDNRILQLRSEDLVEIASTMLNVAENASKKVFPIEGGVEASYLSKTVANSNGITDWDQGTIIECSLATIAQEKDEVTPVCFEFNGERNFNIDPEWVGKEAARLAVSALKGRKTETKSSDVIFTQFAFQELLHFTLVNAVKADYVQRKQSAFEGKVGEQVASDIVTVYDDGLLKGGLKSWRFDGEGVPQQRTAIIEKGVLRNFIYDDYTAKKEGKGSTGNAVRSGYLSTPNVGATNFHFMPRNESPEELVSQVKDGLIVYYLQGAHSSNPASGDFSVVATPAWKIKNGEITNPTKGTMLAGNAFNVLNNIKGLASNDRKMGELVAPWILVENVKVIGK